MGNEFFESVLRRSRKDMLGDSEVPDTGEEGFDAWKNAAGEALCVIERNEDEGEICKRITGEVETEFLVVLEDRELEGSAIIIDGNRIEFLTFEELIKDLDTERGVIHKGANGYREAAQCHDVDGEPEDPKCQQGRGDRDRNGCEGDDRRTNIEQEKNEDDRDKDRSVTRDGNHIVYAQFDEVRLPDDVAIELHPGGHACFYLVKGPVDSPGHL